MSAITSHDTEVTSDRIAILCALFAVVLGLSVLVSSCAPEFDPAPAAATTHP